MKQVPNITFLLYFYHAAQAKSISKAAKHNYVSQSAISQGISRLEKSIGKSLITHEKNRFQLTSEGHLLHDKCKKLFSLFSEIDDAFNETDGVYKGKLSIACTHSFALTQLPIILGKLSHVSPLIEPALRFGHTGMVAELVKNGEVDFGIVLENDDFSSFHSQEIYCGKYQLYQAEKAAKLGLNKIFISEERREVSCLKEFFIDKEMEIGTFIEVQSWEVIANLTEQGMGVGFLPDYVANKHALVPCKIKIPKIPYRLLAIYQKQKKPSRNSKMFIDLICDHFR